MRDVVIANPVINSPFAEPTRHFRFDDDGITEDLVSGRRVSSYFMPIPRTKKKRQLTFDTEWTNDCIDENSPEEFLLSYLLFLPAHPPARSR